MAEPGGLIPDPAKFLETEVVKSVYKDSIQPLAKQTGIALETVGQTVVALLAPCRALVYGLDRFEKEFLPELAKRLEKTPPERLTAPPLTVAGPIVESLKFVGNEPNLREMYVNLLARAMDSKYQAVAHPGYVEIIRQICPDEALILKTFGQDCSSVPLISVESVKGKENPDILAGVDFGGEFVRFIKNFSLLGEQAKCKFKGQIFSYLDNFARLGLIEFSDSRLVDEKHYEPLVNHEYILKAIGKVNASPDHRGRIVKHCLNVTFFGGQFIFACITEPVNEVEKTGDAK